MITETKCKTCGSYLHADFMDNRWCINGCVDIPGIPVGIKLINQGEHECYSCDHEFTFNNNDTHDSCDIIEGQYTVFTAIMCPNCGIENRW